MAGAADTIQENQGDHREGEYDRGLENNFRLMNQQRLAILTDEPGARLFAEYRKDDDDEPWEQLSVTRAGARADGRASNCRGADRLR